MWTVRVTSRDGYGVGVPVQLDTHPGELRPYVLNQIADCLLINRKIVVDVMRDWTHELHTVQADASITPKMPPPTTR